MMSPTAATLTSLGALTSACTDPATSAVSVTATSVQTAHRAGAFKLKRISVRAWVVRRRRVARDALAPHADPDRKLRRRLARQHSRRAPTTDFSADADRQSGAERSQ